MSSNNRKKASSSREAELLERQRDIAMIRAAAAAEASVASSNKPPPPKPANRSLSSFTGLPAKGSAHNPICINDSDKSILKPKEEPKRARQRMKAETVLAQARQRVGSSTEEKDRNVEDNKLKRPSVKRPSINRGNIGTAAPAASAKPSGGSLSSILLSNSNTAKYLSKDAPKLLKHYPKIEPDDYWKNVRDWDFIRELNERMADNRAGGKRMRDDDDAKAKNGDEDTHKTEKQKPLPNTFQSHREYCFLWCPLLLEETRAQLLSDAISDIPYWRSKPEKSPLRVKVEMRKKDTEGNDAVGLVVKEVLSKDWKDRMIMANDVVVLVAEEKMIWDASKGTLSEKTSQKKSSEGASTKSLFGIVGHIEHTRRSVEGLFITISRKIYQQIGCQEMTLLKIGSNVTSQREFTALCRMDRLPLADYILCTKMKVAEDSKPESKSTSTTRNDDDNHYIDPEIQEKQAKKEILQAMGGASALGKGFADYARHKFNLSQLRGISASATEYGDGGFTLIKGPPGTGKTTTLVALINALHIRQMNQYFGEVKVLAESYDAVVGKRASLSLSDAAKKRPRILVCAPSNAAVDNIILKIMEDGFIDGNGMRYNPSIVRIGSGQSASVKDVCLEDKVETYLADSEDISKLDNTIEGLKGECRRIHGDITKLRQRMNAMKTAAPYPLSKDWEIRIDEESDVPRVYFVNHKDKTTTYEVPPPPEPGERHFTARAMPEYKTFVSRVVKMVERYNNINTKIERYCLCRNAAAALSGGGGGAYSRAINDVRLQLETHILDSVHIVMTTLGTAGNRSLEAAKNFQVVVIDEAAQSVEPSTLAGLQLGSSHAILVGDPQQLPATIFNISGRNTKYDRSLFARLEEAGHAVHMLDTQYRMHPAISDFPSRIFYDGKLQDGPNVKHPEYGNPLKRAVYKKFQAFQPFTVLDIESSEERGGTSLSNSAEAQLALHLFNNLKSGTNGLSTKSRVAVITPYSQQAALLRRTFGRSLGGDYEKFVEINTVDAFQGREANIVIFSCVRAAGSKGIGFLSDVRRMNVALTRAKHFLFVIARCSSIVVNPYWRDLVNHARETGAVIKVPFSGSQQSTFIFPDLSTLTVTSAHDKPPMNGGYQSGNADNKKENQVVELMGLKLDIPATKRPR